jgi:hypothetical protein
MAYVQSAPASRTLYCTLADVPVANILYSDVTVGIKKQGATAFTPKILAPADWVNLGGGLYSIQFAPTETDTVGDFTYVPTSILFDNIIYDSFTIEPPPPAGSPTVLPNQCIISGNIANITALAPSQEPLKIVFYPPQFPAKSAQTILAADAAWTFADAYGNFTLPAIQGSTVIVVIKRCGIRAQITVPMSPSANLIDLLPPFVIDYSL